MTPAETLRAAAGLLRETASNATPGPWQIDPEFSDMVTSPEPTWKGQPTIIASDLKDGRDGDRNDATWIALMSPDKAEPLAAWLDGVAKDIDGHDPDGGCECTKSDSYHRAMDFARSILGRTS